MDPLSTHYQVLVIGSGLTESLLAASHARRGDSVLHVDHNPYYGGAWRALNWEQLTSLSGQLDGFSNFRHHVGPAATGLDLDCAHFMVELAPKLLYAQGPLVQLFQKTGIGRHLDFKLLDGTYMTSFNTPEIVDQPGPILSKHQDSQCLTIRVPASKEDVFTSNTISLIEKRRLMKFLTSVVDPNIEFPSDATFGQLIRQYNINDQLESVLRYGIALLTDLDAEVPASIGITRLNTYLKSVGQFGNSPFIMCMYGGSGELCQSMCRISAVYGGVYILGRPITDLGWDNEQSVWKVTLGKPGIEEPLCFTANKIVANPYTLAHYLRTQTNNSQTPCIESFCAIMITTQSIRQDSHLGLFIVPPNVVSDLNNHHSSPHDAHSRHHPVQILDMGGDMHICPSHMRVIHFRASSLLDLEVCLAKIVPASSIVHTVYYTHVNDPTIVVPSNDFGPVHITSGISMALDLDSDIRPILTQWTAEHDDTQLFFEPLPNPEEDLYS